jgi:DNA-3-methyladenine glycosylase II
MWRRRTGFSTLVHIILEQQVSLKSAKAMLLRLQSSIDPFTPERFVALGESHLRELGVTRQKSAYLLHLSGSILNGELNLNRFSRMDDDDVRQQLTRIKGIGSWSADVYLLMAMRRADIWPAGDLALAVAAKELLRLEIRPTPTNSKRSPRSGDRIAPSPRACCGNTTSARKFSNPSSGDVETPPLSICLI